jgi:hypothetical protein
MPALCPRQISAFRGTSAKLIMDYRHATEGAGDFADADRILMVSKNLDPGNRIRTGRPLR